MAGETSFLAMIANTSALLFERLSEVNWAGFYLLEGEYPGVGTVPGQTGLRADPGRARRMRRGGGARLRSSVSRTSSL